MLVRTDDEVYRVDAVWLGPPRATFPWRARYVSYALGLGLMILVMFVQRRVGIELSFFSVAWGLVITVVLTRLIGQRISYDRPAGQVAAMFTHELTGPRRRTARRGGAVLNGHVRVNQPAPARPAGAQQRSRPPSGTAAMKRAPAKRRRAKRPRRPVRRQPERQRRGSA